MYKLLLVDDEAMETEALGRIITRQYGDKTGVFTATNGKTAIAMAEEIRPDIVLMDIEMPGINGLDAAQSIRQMLPRTRIIIVTAYERFQYAQAAIALGAEGYLLKPVSNGGLFRLLDGAMEEIEKDRNDTARRSMLDQLAQDQFVLSIISGYSGAASLQRQLDDLRVAFDYGFFCAFKSIGREAAEQVMLTIRKHLPVRPELTVLLYEYDRSVLAAVLMHTPVFYGETDVLNATSKLLHDVKADTGMQLLAGIGPMVTDIGDMLWAYEVSAAALESSTPEIPIALPSAAKDMHKPQKGLERKLYSHLLEKDMDAALRCIDTAFDALLYSKMRPEMVMETMRKLMRRVAGKLQRDARMPDDLAATLSVLEGDDLTQQEMAISIRNLLAEWMSAVDAQPPARMQRIRMEIERYIQQHFSEDLSIKQVAHEMHYSEPYFSKLFSRCFHRNFVSYLTDIRMQAARDLLAGSMQSIRDISMTVGFSDANYFAKVFRKTYGVSPTEYRRFASTLEGGTASGEVSDA